MKSKSIKDVKINKNYKLKNSRNDILNNESLLNDYTEQELWDSYYCLSWEYFYHEMKDMFNENDYRISSEYEKVLRFIEYKLYDNFDWSFDVIRDFNIHEVNYMGE